MCACVYDYEYILIVKPPILNIILEYDNLIDGIPTPLKNSNYQLGSFIIPNRSKKHNKDKDNMLETTKQKNYDGLIRNMFFLNETWGSSQKKW